MASPSSISHLIQMPVELLLRITHYLTTPELGCVRLTCKALERSLFNFFSHEFFRKRQFMILERSLQTLVDISKHKALSPFLKHVIIATDQVDNRYYMDHVGNVGSESQLWSLELAHADQIALMTTATARDMLVEAFRNLPNLETIDLRDFNSNTRKRDGSRWKSYGATTLEQDTGYATEMCKSSAESPIANYASDLYATILSALAASGLHPPNLEVILRNPRWGITDEAMAIPKLLEPRLAPVLAGLKKLHLTLNFVPHGYTNASSFFSANLSNSPFTRSFLSQCHNVTWLRLNFRDDDEGEPRQPNLDFLTWLGTPVPDASVSSATPNGIINHQAPVAFASLEKLDLGFVTADVPAILRIVKKFAPNLKALTLYKLVLKASFSTPFTPAWIHRKTPNLWAKLLTGLLRATQRGLNLQQLHLGYMSQSPTVHHNCPAWFQESENAAREYGRSHAGESDMAKFIEKLASDVRVDSLDAMEVEQDDGDGNDENEDSDDSDA